MMNTQSGTPRSNTAQSGTAWDASNPAPHGQTAASAHFTPHPHDATVEHVEGLAKLMDSQFNIPGIPMKLGLDTLVGLVPGIGDTIGLGVSGYIMSRAAQAGVSKGALVRMGGNVGIDWLIGLVPVIGDLFDWGWKANNRNAAILRAHIERERQQLAPPIVDVSPSRKA